MDYIKKISGLKVGEKCTCPICRNSLAVKERSHEFTDQVFCESCGRYAIYDTLLSDGPFLELLVQDRLRLAEKLQDRNEKESCAYISKDTFRFGIISQKNM